jgi:flagellar biosynthesis/type III secretory pathway protein FliH
MKLDTAQVIKQVVIQIENIIDGLEVYKNAFETVAGQLCSTAMQIVHEIIVKSKGSGQANGLSSLIAEEDLGQVSKLLLSVLRVIADSMISEGTSLPFVSELKRRLTYELSLTQSFQSESTLTLSFDV